MSTDRRLWHLKRVELESFRSYICHPQFELKASAAGGEFMNRSKFIYYVASPLIKSGVDLFLFLFLAILIYLGDPAWLEMYDVLKYCDNYLWVLFNFFIESSNITNVYFYELIYLSSLDNIYLSHFCLEIQIQDISITAYIKHTTSLSNNGVKIILNWHICIFKLIKICHTCNSVSTLLFGILAISSCLLLLTKLQLPEYPIISYV